jgi:hypothetical protein
MKVADEGTSCTAQHFGGDGLPTACMSGPVWALSHSNGEIVYFCEFHIECFWGMWLPFREAVREVWPTFAGRNLR